MEKNYLSETEIISLRHVFGVGQRDIEQFEHLNLNFEAKQFILFTLLSAAYEKGKRARK